MVLERLDASNEDQAWSRGEVESPYETMQETKSGVTKQQMGC